MDYLVFGVGFGSTLVLVGWVLRQYGPSLRFRDSSDDVLSAEALLERNDWQRFCIALGALLSVGGAVMLLATLVTMLIHPSDSVGTMIVGIIFALTLIAVAGWVVMYVNQHRALAGDRHIEAIEESRARNIAATRTATPDPETDTENTPTAGPKPATAQTQHEQAQRRAAQQRQARGETAPQQPSARTPATNTAPPATRERRAQEGQHPMQGSPAKAAAPQPSPTRPIREEPAIDPVSERHGESQTPALRNVQFKRTAANRAQQERRPTPPSTHAYDDETDGDGHS